MATSDEKLITLSNLEEFKNNLAAVAISNNYNDLDNKPTIPTSLKNPNALGFKANSETSAFTTYDGSGAKNIIFAPSTTAGAFTISDGTTTKTIQLAGKFTDNSGVTSVATNGTGLSGGTITTTGTITLDSSSAGNAATNKVVLRNAAGSIQSEKIAISSGTTTKATMQYDTTNDCIKFVFS